MKRKRMQDMTDVKKVKETPLPSRPVITSITPDYAAVLNATSTFAPATPARITTPAAPVVTTVQTPVQITTIATTTPAVPTTPTTVTKAMATPQYTTVGPMSPLIATKPTGQRTAVFTEQPSTSAAVPIVPPVLFTGEQILEAQDMFRSANAVTRCGKMVILRFMAGSRHNPCPSLGNIYKIKLSEHQINVLQPDETFLPMIVETHFHMNYNNGEWKLIKKYRHIENMNSDQAVEV